MKSSDFYKLFESTELLDKDSLKELTEIVVEYPCFAVARILLLKNLAMLNDIRFDAELKKNAIYFPDPRKVFSLIESDKYKIEPEMIDSSQDDSFSLIDAFLSTREDAPASDANPLLFQPSVSSDYIYWSLSEHPEENEEKADKLQHQDLIDSFLRNDEDRGSRSNLIADENDQKPINNIDENNTKGLDDSYFTETLAHIYIKQKRYEKALQIIKNLSLKYPEKNVYFADQIRFLEKLIINSKK